MGDLTHRPLREIAEEIVRDWKNVNFGAKPYLNALRQLTTTKELYGMDDGKSIVLYFLANAKTWKGETAKRIKKELKEIVGIK